MCLERSALISSSIAEVTKEEKEMIAQASDHHLTPVQRKLRAFKISSAEVQAQGRARLRFERMVKRAEKKIIEEKRKAMEQDVSKLTESYAQELLHTPGNLLTAQEIYEIYKYSGCASYFNKTVKYGCHCAQDEVWRRSDGTCNNQYYPRYGSAQSPMRRILNAQYDDGISMPRGLMQLEDLDILDTEPGGPPNPNPRVVSTTIITDVNLTDSNHTLMIMQWGQFMDHDLDFMPEYTDTDCHGCGYDEADVCTPIPIPGDDERLSGCLEFRRSLPVCGTEDSQYILGPRNHINTITHLIDASTVYHHNKIVLKELRGSKGTLKMTDETGKIGMDS